MKGRVTESREKICREDITAVRIMVCKYLPFVDKNGEEVDAFQNPETGIVHVSQEVYDLLKDMGGIAH